MGGEWRERTNKQAVPGVAQIYSCGVSIVPDTPLFVGAYRSLFFESPNTPFQFTEHVARRRPLWWKRRW